MKLSRTRIVKALMGLGFYDIRQLASYSTKRGFRVKRSDDWDDSAALAVEGIKSTVRMEQGKRVVETELKLSNRKGALETLLKMHGWDGKQDDDLSAEDRVRLMKALMGQMDEKTSTRSKKK